MKVYSKYKKLQIRLRIKKMSCNFFVMIIIQFNRKRFTGYQHSMFINYIIYNNYFVIIILLLCIYLVSTVIYTHTYTTDVKKNPIIVFKTFKHFSELNRIYYLVLLF